MANTVSIAPTIGEDAHSHDNENYKMKLRPLTLALLSLLMLVGCANTTKQHFETDPSTIRAGKAMTANSDRASVYMMREWALGQGFLPPLFYAVDETMVSAMPLGAYVPLSLEPGAHTFTKFTVVPGGGLAPFQVRRADVKLELGAGQTYYVSEVNAFSNTFRQVDSDRGREILDATELAKFIHAPVRTSVFVSRLQEAERIRKAAPVTAQPSPSNTQTQLSITAGFQEFLPSSNQVGDALQVVATVALVALYIIALGAAGSADTHQAAAPISFSSPPSFSRPSAMAAEIRSQGRPAAQRPIEPLAEVERLKKERTVTNAATGVKYVFDGDRVKGSDGSNYRLSGTMMYSDSGQSYQVVGGKFVYASDGRNCTLIGNNLHC